MYLMHYGRKGQKWGVHNGPPYPLDAKTVSRAYGKKKTKISYGYSSPYKTRLDRPNGYWIIPPNRRLNFNGIKTRGRKEYTKEYNERKRYFENERIKEQKRTSSDVKSILDSMSDTELKLLNIPRNRINEYANDGEYFVKRFLAKDENNIPVAFLDLEDDHGVLNVVIGTRGEEQYRRKGYADAVTKAGMSWVDKNAQYLDVAYDDVVWRAYNQNTGSRHLAEKNDFVQVDDGIPESERSDWDDVEYARKVKSKH